MFGTLKLCYDGANLYQGVHDMDARERMELHGTIQPNCHPGFQHNVVGGSTGKGREKQWVVCQIW